MTETKNTTRRPAKSKGAKILRITLVHSPIGTTYRHKATLTALGFRRLQQTVEKADSPQVRGMLAKVGFLVKVEEAASEAGKEKQK